MKIILILLLGFLSSTLLASNQPPLYLHLVPHTHNDLGWLYTVKSYYLGTNPRGCVECILNNVTAALYDHPERRFSYVEMGYFRIWWSNQNDTTKMKVIQLQQNGQLEFLNAGVVMNDEGAAYYDDIIEQMSKGLRFVKDTFNYTVKVGWHIDIFGHTAAQASMFSQMGFNSWLFERIDYQDFNHRMMTSSMETIWKPNTFSDINYILTHINSMSYYLAPFDWCIGMFCFPSNTPFDSMQKMFKYATWVQNQSNMYISDHILHHIGGDFEWANDTEYNYQDLEVLIDFLNAHQEFGIIPFFSTPGNYTNSVYQDFLEGKTKPLSTKVDDFMPYVDQPHAYWTGYYTSRAVYKGQVRAGGQRLQTIRKILSKMLLEKPTYFKKSYEDFEGSLDQYEEINAILQHHDSVTGTAKQNVTDNYVGMLQCAADDINQIVNGIFSNYTKETLNEEFVHKECVLSESRYHCSEIYEILEQLPSALLTIYNPSTETKRLIHIKVPKIEIKIVDENNNPVDADIMCDDYSNSLNCTLYFYADIPTNSFASYKISLGDVVHSNIIPAVKITGDTDFAFQDNTTLRAFSNLTDFILLQSNSQYPFSINYKYYKSYYEGDQDQASGAYIFRPAQNYSNLYSQVIDGRYFVGKTLIQLQIRGKNVITSIKLNRYMPYNVPVIQVDTLTLPVDISDGIGKEITINFLAPFIDNQNTFYTDSNGLEMQKRILNYRETYDVNLTEPIAGNYYPVFTSIYIEDPNTLQRMTVMNDRSQGGSSLNKSEIELMIQRRILHDDNRGVAEALNETDKNGVGIEVRVTHYLFFSQDDTASSVQRQLQYSMDTQPLVFLSASFFDTFIKYIKRDISQGLAPLIKFYIRPYNDTNFLIRLHNLNEKENVNVELIDSENKPIILGHLIGDTYPQYSVSLIEELALGANQNKKDMLEAKYRWDGNFSGITYDDDLNSTTLGPLEMKVFNITLDSQRLSKNSKDQSLTNDDCHCIFTAGPNELVEIGTTINNNGTKRDKAFSYSD